MKARFPALDLLPEVFAKYPGIQAVYLFGSAARGRTHTESDLDLAIFPRNSNVRMLKLDILADLARQGFENVDLVFLDTNNILLKFEAIKQNRIIYQADDFDSGSVYSLTLRQYFDFLRVLDVQGEALKRRVLYG